MRGQNCAHLARSINVHLPFPIRLLGENPKVLLGTVVRSRGWFLIYFHSSLVPLTGPRSVILLLPPSSQTGPKREQEAGETKGRFPVQDQPVKY